MSAHHNQALTRALRFVALSGPMAWASDWHRRAFEAHLREEFDDQPMTLADVLPWRSSAAKPAPSAWEPTDDDRATSRLVAQKLRRLEATEVDAEPKQPAQAESPVRSSSLLREAGRES